MTAGVFMMAEKAASSDSRPSRSRSRSVCAATSAIEEARGIQRVIGQNAARPGPLERHQGLEDQRVAVAGSGRGCMFDHRIFAGHLIGEGRNAELASDRRDDVE